MRPIAPPVGIDCIGLCASVAGRTLVEGVDLRIAPGERRAIVGPNGAGKTSLLRMLFGHLKPGAGRVLVGGRDLAALAPLERARLVAVVGQHDVPDARLTVADYVGLGRLPHRGRTAPHEDMSAIAAAIERTGLSNVSDRRIGGLSGGERQRAAIARAVAQEPAVLVLDEPTNHLDPRARSDMLGLARDLRITVVAVLHDLALVTPFADRVAVMRGGRIVADGTPAEALSPQTVRAVFAMDCFPFTNPSNGRPLLVFDTPTTPTPS